MTPNPSFKTVLIISRPHVVHQFLSVENGSLRGHPLDTCEFKLTEFKIGTNSIRLKTWKTEYDQTLRVWL